MSFSDAIPLNRISDSEMKYDSAMKRERSNDEWSRKAKQKVNISEKTAYKTARVKLNNALAQKLAYNNSGKMGSRSAVGQLFQAQA